MVNRPGGLIPQAPGGPSAARSWRPPIASVAFYGCSAALALGCALGAGLTTFHGHVPASILLGATVFAGAGVVFACLAACRPGLSPRLHRAWRWILPANVLRFAAMATYLVTGGSARFPGLGDLFALLSFPLLARGMFTVPHRDVGPLESRRLLLDAGTFVVGGVLILWYAVLGSHYPSPGPTGPAFATAVLLPLGDLVMVFVAVTVRRRTTEPAAQLPLFLLAFGWAWEAASVPYLVHLRLSGRSGDTFPAWLEVVYVVANFLWAAGAFEQARRSRSGPGPLPSGGRSDWLPYAGVAVGLAILLAATARVSGGYSSGVMVGVVVLIILVLLRQHTVLGENRQLATTDALTGLANRGRLLSEFDHALAAAERSGRRVGVLMIDLDHFKLINDRFGHDAGDEALRRFAGMLRRAVREYELIGRLGGDEFAIVLRDIESEAEPVAVVRRVHAETDTPISVGGGSVLLRASVGVAVSGPGDRDPDELMRKADASMYEAKRLAHGRTGPGTAGERKGPVS